MPDHTRDIHPEDLAPILERFHARFEPSHPLDCWNWTGGVTVSGYGRLTSSVNCVQRHWFAHRVAWVVASGQPLTDELTIDHLCRNTLCVNPGHLEPVTQAENSARVRRAEWITNPPAGEPRECPECGAIYRSKVGMWRHRKRHQPSPV